MNISSVPKTPEPGMVLIQERVYLLLSVAANSFLYTECNPKSVKRSKEIISARVHSIPCFKLCHQKTFAEPNDLKNWIRYSDLGINCVPRSHCNVNHAVMLNFSSINVLDMTDS